MKKFFLILLIGFCLSITKEGIYDNSWALLIGIDKYQNVQGLDYAVKDAESVNGMLVDFFQFNPDNIISLKNEEATKSNIIKEFSNITKKAQSNDRILIFFAGHGETEDLPDGGEIGYFLPVDGDKTDLYVSAIKMDELKTISLRSKAKHILYLVDACYGGIIGVGSRGLNQERPSNYIDKITKYKSRQIISAGGRGEKVLEKPEWGHSAFTKNLLSGLKNWMADGDDDGIITAQELGVFLKKKVTIDSDNQQTPKIRNLTSDEGEFVFFQHSDAVSITEITATENINTKSQNLGLNLNSPSWENIKHTSMGYMGNDYGDGVYLSGEKFLNDGIYAVSIEGAGLFSSKYQTVIISPSIKKYISSYSDSYVGAGVSFFIVDKYHHGESHEKNYYGLAPYISWGNLDGIDHSDCNHGKLYNLIYVKNDITIRAGYRFMEKDASEINEESGFFITLGWGKFRRFQSKSTKIHPVIPSE